METTVQVHHGVTDCVPTPRSVTVTMPWEDFVKLFALVGKSSPAKCRESLDEVKTLVGVLRRPASAYVISHYDLGKVYQAMLPVFKGDAN